MAGLLSRSQTSKGTHLLVYWCIQLGHLFSLFREHVRNAGREGAALGVLGRLPCPAGMLQLVPVRRKAVPSRGALHAQPLILSSSLRLHVARGLFLLHILQKLFTYDKFVTQIVRLHDHTICWLKAQVKAHWTRQNKISYYCWWDVDALLGRLFFFPY